MPIKYVPFVPEPVEGQAVLNFNRILKYKGIDDTSMTLERGMPLYEVEKLETVGENKDNNMVFRGECITTCAYLKEHGIEVDLVYIDPPFASGADYAKKIYVRRNPKVAEAIAQAEQEIESEELHAFEEKMYGDVWDKEKYLNWMYENLLAIKSVMSETASIYVHLDYHIGHYVKILLDELFGEDRFLNEIIWYYETYQGTVKKYFPKKHDTLFLYSKSPEYTFNLQYSDDVEESINYKRWKEYIVDGNKIMGDNYPASDSRFMARYNKWVREHNRVPKAEDIVFEVKTMAYNSVWKDIKPVDPKDEEEKLPYITQKPEALLQRIISSSSNENMLVADFFGGSGVTAAVANKLNRRFITCDIGINSIQTIRDRLVADNAEFDVLEIKDGIQLYRNPVQTMDKLKALIPGLKNEDALDSFWEGVITDTKKGSMPVYIPNLMDSSSKLLDKVMMNRIIHEAIPDLPVDTKRVIVYYVDITSEKEIYDFINEDDSTAIEIELRDLKTILDDVVVEDYAEFSLTENEADLINKYSVTIDSFSSDRVYEKIREFNSKNLLNDKKKNFKPIEISNEGLEMIEYLSLDCENSEGAWTSSSEIKIDKKGFVILNGNKTKEFWDGKINSETKPLRIKIRNICGDETVWSIEDK